MDKVWGETPGSAIQPDHLLARPDCRSAGRVKTSRGTGSLPQGPEPVWSHPVLLWTQYPLDRERDHVGDGR